MPSPNRASVGVTVRCPREALVLSKFRQECSLYLAGAGVPRDATPGSPALPFRKHFVCVPPDARELTVSSVDGPRAVIGTGIVLTPVQPDLPTLLGAEIRRVGPDPKAYAAAAELPSVPCRVVALRHLGGLRLAEIEVCPLRYRPKTGELQLVTSMDLTIGYQTGGAAVSKARSLAQLRFELRAAERLRRLVCNPADVARHLRFDHAALPQELSILPSVKHVVVTPQALQPSFQRLSDWRTRLGLPSRTVAVEDIVAGTVADTGGMAFWQAAGYADGGTRDTAEAVRNFIKWAALNWDTEYVVLGGDILQVPVRQGLQTACSEVRYGNLATPDTGVPLGFAATASSAFAGAPASNVADANAATVWRPAATDAAPWLQLDLGLRRPLNGLELTWGTPAAAGYAIDVSPDASTWTRVFSTASATGGTELRSWTAASVRYLRLSVTSGANFALGTCRAFGPMRASYSGTAYAIDATTTRMYLSRYMTPNPTNAPAGDLVLVLAGAHKGQRIPYDPAAGAGAAGWRFVNDLVGASSVASGYTGYLEVRGPADWHGQPFVLKGDINYIATDLYLSDVAAADYPTGVQHDWDADGDEVYGERYGGELDQVNGLADVRIGRLPADDAVQAGLLVDKIIHYEKYERADPAAPGGAVPLGPAFATSCVLGSQNWFSNVSGALDASAQGNEDIRHMIQAAGTGWTFVRRYEDAADVPAADAGTDLAAASNPAIVAAINAGANVIGLSSHGSPGYLCYLSSGDVDTLGNPPGIVYGNACSTNKFDEAGSDCLGERFVLNAGGGAVAYVGNTRFGWTGDNPLEFAFWQEMFASGVLGAMLDACHLAAGPWGKYSLNLLGDPAMRVWTRAARAATVTHRGEVCTGAQTVAVTVSADGSPVAGARVCLSIPGVLNAVGTTDATGLAAIAINTSAAATMSVCVSGANLLPYEGTVQVKLCGSPCGARIVCKPAVSCGPVVTCKKEIICSHAIICRTAIACGQLIQCGSHIACGVRIECGRPILCGAAIQCGPRIGACTRLRPNEVGLPGEIRAIWGIDDLSAFARRLDDPEVKATLARLPAGLGKAITLMAQRIREEDGL